MDYLELEGICRRGGKSWAKACALVSNPSPEDKPATQSFVKLLDRDERFARIFIDEPTELTEEAKKIIFDDLFEDAESWVEHIKKNMPRILTEHIKRENELAERMKGDWNFKERN